MNLISLTETTIDKGMTLFERLPILLRHSFFPFLLISLPFLLASAFGFVWMLPIIGLITTVLIYQISDVTDRFLFEIDSVQSHFKVTMPLMSFTSLWAILLHFVGRDSILLGVVGPYIFLLILACAPVYRLKSKANARWLSKKISFSLTGLMILVVGLAEIFK